MSSSDTVPMTSGFPEAYLGNKVQNQMGKSCCFGGQMGFESSGDSESWWSLPFLGGMWTVPPGWAWLRLLMLCLLQKPGKTPGLRFKDSAQEKWFYHKYPKDIHFYGGKNQTKPKQNPTYFGIECPKVTICKFSELFHYFSKDLLLLYTCARSHG